MFTVLKKSIDQKKRKG